VLTVFAVPSHVNETTEPVDNLGGILSIFFVGLLVLAINFLPVAGKAPLAIGLGAVALAAGAGFFVRQRRAATPLYDLHVAARPTFWVAAVGGIIVFGSLMAAIFVGQQFLQDVLGYSPLEAGAAAIPAAVFLVLVAPVSARMVTGRGGRFTLLLGYVVVFLGFVFMLLFWKEGIGYWQVAVGYSLIGIGVGFAATPASQSLTGSVPVARAGMASATADLQRDLGGAIMQSILGALLTAGYAASLSRAISDDANADEISGTVQATLTKSFAGAESVAERYPQYSSEIIDTARTAFVAGQNWAFAVGAVAILVGAAIVFFVFPKHEKELRLREEYLGEDMVKRRPDVG
jgi:DHA2 family multidrug resistance protein-like MFS transporter